MENVSSVSKEDDNTQLLLDMQKASRNVEDIISVSSPGGHKRTLSGSILSKLSFLRPTEVDNGGGNVLKTVDTGGELRNYGSHRSALASALQQQKNTRKRKGSLRKTALLGTGKLKWESREKRPLGLETAQLPLANPNQSPDVHGTSNSLTSHASLEEDTPTPRQSYEKSTYVISKIKGMHSEDATYNNNPSEENLFSDSLSRLTIPGDLSTTDEDDAITFERSTNLMSGPPISKSHSSSGSESYFPSGATGLQRRRSSNKPKSPLGTLTVDSIASHDEWDYSETEWWGWIVLLVTWVVFVVGMGSCFEVWSWAWDVGETPQAPPELSDDPTLPIVGYYPALIILTAVMAWVWVVIAWVGMKYFKHAKISGEM